MIRCSVLYPHAEGARFDHDYYAEKHVPLAKRSLGDALRRVEVDRALDGGSPGSFVAGVHLYFESTEAFQEAFASAAQGLMEDVPNYTDIQPQIFVAETNEA